MCNSMIKIVVINGSPRKNGATAKLLNKMVEHLVSKQDVEIEYIHISDYSLESCSGCMSCYRSSVCCLKDSVEEINKSISEAHGIIIGSPTYSSSMPGSLKTFIDRGHFVLEQSLVGKYTFALSTYEIAGGNNVIKELKTLFQYSGGITSGSFSCKLPFNTSPFKERKVEKKIISKTDIFYRAIVNKKSKSILNAIINFVALHIVMKPQVLKRPQQYKAVLDRWRLLNIVKSH